ncbi:MAG: aminopeptidase P family protein [Microscillaceae bacterium]|jgi:Xaa-Pro aminopeptidase|nr:aminopeptidase P family protein [Microscillaceae bacterium]
MKYLPINPVLFIKNRQNFVAKLKPNSLALFNSNDIMPTNADGTMRFRQNNDLFYLSGIDQEESILVIFPDAKEEKFKEVLFLRETNEHIAVWEGHKYTKSEATQTSGIRSVFWLSEFKTIFNALMGQCENVYLNTNEHSRAAVEVETRDLRFIKWCKENYPLHTYQRVTPLMHHLRAIKQKEELELMQHACNITEKGFRRLLKFVKPGVTEYEIEAELLHEFVRNRSRGFAYEPIIASGAGSCVLHYVENNQVCQAGDVLLLDVAAEYANYNSDLTRTIPVSGKFTPRQKAVYNAVLGAMKYCKSLMKPGALWDDNQKATGEYIEKQLVDLKLLTLDEIKNQNPDFPAYKKYFMHGVSHFLGLDVHDVGDKFRRFEAGMVFTCEPGIYIREENLGIRLENNILITESGNFDLMANIPLEAEEIEDLMNA